MADYTKTITNSINLFGVGPSSKWGQSTPIYTMTWGVTKWGEGSFPQVFTVVKVASSAIIPDTTYSKSVVKLIEDSVTPNDAFPKTLDKIIYESFSVLSDNSSEQLSNGIWKTVFVSDTTNAENRDFASWTSASRPSSSFTCATAGTTTWS